MIDMIDMIDLIDLIAMIDECVCKVRRSVRNVCSRKCFEVVFYMMIYDDI